MTKRPEREIIAAKATFRDLLETAAKHGGRERRRLHPDEVPLSASEWRVLAAVMHQLSLFDRVDDRIATTTLAEISGMSTRQTRRLLVKLRERGIGLAYLPGKRDGHASYIAVGVPSTGGAGTPDDAPSTGGAGAPDDAPCDGPCAGSQGAPAEIQDAPAAIQGAQPAAMMAASEYRDTETGSDAGARAKTKKTKPKTRTSRTSEEAEAVARQMFPEKFEATS